MNISGDISISEFKPQQYPDNTPTLPTIGAFIGKSSFLDLMKSLQGSAQKGLDETLTGIQNTFSKTEVPTNKEEKTEIIEDKTAESVKTKDEAEVATEETSKEEEELESVEEATNATALPWFLVAEAKPNETVDPEIESAILDELQNEIIEEVSVETLESKPSSTSELIETLFAKEESTELLSEVAFEEENAAFQEIAEESFLSLEDSKEVKRPISKREESIREEESKSSETKSASEISRTTETNAKESKENVNTKNLSNKETVSKGAEEARIEVSKELALDSEKWKISRDKKTDSYMNLKTSAREEIKTAVLNQFSENSSGKSGQEQSFRSGGNDSYSSLVKGVGGPTVAGREPSQLGKDFSVSKETNVLSKRDVQQNFQNLIRSARVQILENGKTEASIRMNPKDLGQMSLSISTDKDIVRGKLLVESDAVKQQLVAELANLKQDLKANGLELESLVIEVKEREESFSFNQDSDKNGKDANSFQAAFGEEWNSDFKNSFYEEDELFGEENSQESHGFSEKTDGKTEKLLDLKV
ncbi:flagellar hook-length control protein FliK [Leptospira barantonii]|uniref:Flagellar hook-length control protein FliK n=1 Tax=Leptospira barantonii TaxID=2023184 RepID=A0ABX4NLS0_9LEPT|nr:flagellar hook-length control protein FliK [Leptospira barantonii]PJZ57770.1 flagellar hook-length control protein FliK [Leptospira barantonii]